MGRSASPIDSRRELPMHDLDRAAARPKSFARNKLTAPNGVSTRPRYFFLAIGDSSGKKSSHEFSRTSSSGKKSSCEFSRIGSSSKKGSPEFSWIGSSVKINGHELSRIGSSVKKGSHEFSGIGSSGKKRSHDFQETTEILAPRFIPRSDMFAIAKNTLRPVTQKPAIHRDKRPG